MDYLNVDRAEGNFCPNAHTNYNFERTQEIGHLLATTDSIKKVFLGAVCTTSWDKRLSDHTIEPIAKALESNTSIEEFDISESRVGDDGVKKIFDAISNNPKTSINFINLYYCRISGKFIDSTIHPFLEQHPNIKIHHEMLKPPSARSIEKTESDEVAKLIEGIKLSELTEKETEAETKIVDDSIQPNKRTEILAGKGSEYAILLNAIEKNHASINSEELKTWVLQLDVAVLKDILAKSYQDCKNGSNLSGYIFLFLMKEVFKSDFEIPSVISCSFPNIEDGMKACLKEYPTHPDRKKISDLLLFTNRPFPLFLSHIFNKVLIDYLLNAINQIPFSEWPRKEIVLIEFFRIISHLNELKIECAQIFASEQGHIEMREIGLSFYKAFTAKGPSELYPHINRLLKLMPNFHNAQVKHIFGCFYPDFGYGERAELNYEEQLVLSCNNLLLKWKKDPFVLKESCLVAYDALTKDIKWITPINSYYFHCYVTELGIVVRNIRNANKANLRVLNPENGEIIGDIPMPVITPASDFHITPSGFCFFSEQRDDDSFVVGARLTLSNMKVEFSKRRPQGGYYSSGNKIYFFDELGSDTKVYFSEKGEEDSSKAD